MLQMIVFALWFLLPAGLANIAPVLSAHLPFLSRFNTPIDYGRSWRGQRLLGDNKTWRGLMSGIFIATVTLWLQQIATEHTSWAQYAAGSIDYSHLPVLLLGPLFAIGALGGDAIESFFKRRRGIPSGKAWVPFDQVDYIIGTIIITLPFALLSAIQYLIILFLWFGMHIIVCYIGWRIGLKKEPI